MPGLPLVTRETTYSGSADQMCHHSQVRLSPEELLAAEESFSIYCKPVEFYNIIQRRAASNPLFLQRCLDYKIEAKHARRIQMTVSLYEHVNGVQQQNFSPLYVMLARPISDISGPGHSAVYRVGRERIIADYKEQTEAHFILRELHKLLEQIKDNKLAILLVNCGESRSASSRRSPLKEHLENAGGYCKWGKISVESLYSSWEKSGNLNLGNIFEIPSTVAMHSSFVEASYLDEGSCISFQIPHNSEITQLQVKISAQEVGNNERSPYDSYSYDNVPVSSLPEIMRLRAGNVLFHYSYYNKTLRQTEVTEDFTCSFCLVKCGNFKGLKLHLDACHDLFNFEFWLTDDVQAVDVSLKTDVWNSEIVEDDPKLEPFKFCSNSRRRRRSKNKYQNENHVRPLILNLDSPEVNGIRSCKSVMDMDADASSSKERVKNPNPFFGGNDWQNAESNGSETAFTEVMERVGSSQNVTGVSTATAPGIPECSQQAPPMLQFAKTRKLSIERSDPRNRVLLQKRQFFHSHRAQPMALEQVLSDRDSEDEVDDDVADFEDRRMLDDFVDVTKDEKQIMHLWNSFVRKQRVLADGHVPWACEAFSKLHGKDLAHSPKLIWCWRLFMIKLWNHSLLDGRSMDICNRILERYEGEIGS
uniref:Polycomb group protein EMF2 n=1 Tax=Eschscholzia californica TaxID=3467 RepID=Q1W621_ESCCA|nr:polycomb group protein EMF2 [Eschscholzia californica]